MQKVSAYRYRWRTNSGLEHISRYCSYCSTQARFFIVVCFFIFVCSIKTSSLFVPVSMRSSSEPNLGSCTILKRGPRRHSCNRSRGWIRSFGAGVLIEVMNICSSPSPMTVLTHMTSTIIIFLVLLWVAVAVSVAWWWCSDHFIGSTTVHKECTGWQRFWYFKDKT